MKKERNESEKYNPQPLFRYEWTASSALNHRNVPVFETLCLRSVNLFPFARPSPPVSLFGTFSLTHRIKKARGVIQYVLTCRLVSYSREGEAFMPRQKTKDKARGTINEMQEGWNECIVIYDRVI